MDKFIRLLAEMETIVIQASAGDRASMLTQLEIMVATLNSKFDVEGGTVGP